MQTEFCAGANKSTARRSSVARLDTRSSGDAQSSVMSSWDDDMPDPPKNSVLDLEQRGDSRRHENHILLGKSLTILRGPLIVVVRATSSTAGAGERACPTDNCRGGDYFDLPLGRKKAHTSACYPCYPPPLVSTPPAGAALRAHSMLFIPKRQIASQRARRYHDGTREPTREPKHDRMRN